MVIGVLVLIQTLKVGILGVSRVPSLETRRSHFHVSTYYVNERSTIVLSHALYHYLEFMRTRTSLIMLIKRYASG